MCFRATAAIEILDRICDGYEAENERLRKSADAYKEAAEIFQRKAYEEQKQREALEVENRRLKSQLTESAEKLSSMDTDLVTLMWHSGEGCEICAHAIKEQRGEFIQYRCALGGGVDCRPEWRGNREAE